MTEEARRAVLGLDSGAICNCTPEEIKCKRHVAIAEVVDGAVAEALEQAAQVAKRVHDEYYAEHGTNYQQGGADAADEIEVAIRELAE